MAPSSHSLTVRGPTADDDPAHTFKVFRAWLIALCCFTILVILGSSSLIIALLNRWREACDKYDDLKKASARLSSINDYLTRRLDTIEPQLDRLRGRAYLSSRTPYRPWVTSRLPPAPLGSPASSHSVSDSAVNPFAAIGDDWSTSGGDVDDDNSIHTTRAQPIVRTVFTDGSSPRPLIMTPGLSDGDSQRGKLSSSTSSSWVQMRDFVSPLRESGRFSRGNSGRCLTPQVATGNAPKGQ
jgi:hypothetical protein